MKPWICHKCGEATTGEACSYCMTRALPDAGAFYAIGSYFWITQGYKGYYALPRSLAVLLIATWMWNTYFSISEAYSLGTLRFPE